MREFIRRIIPIAWRRALRDAIASARRVRRVRRARTALRRYTRSGAPPATNFGAPTAGTQPVLVCLWHRPARLPTIIDMLARQSSPDGIHLVLWNNDPSNDESYRKVLSTAVRGAIKSIEFISSPVNVGGAARMIAADGLSRRGDVGPVVMLDDDQDVGDGFVEALRSAWSPRTYAGVWAWRIHGDYWDRTRADDCGAVTYVGTGGSIVDLELLIDPQLRRKLDSKDVMIEDLLLSWCAHERGYQVRAVCEGFSFLDDEHGQWTALARAKSDLYARMGSFARFPR